MKIMTGIIRETKEENFMKKQIRRSVFETNSSSTHSLTMMMKSDYVRWQNEKLYLYEGGYGWEFSQPIKNSLYTKEEVLNFAKKNRYWHGDVEDEYKEYEMLRDMGFISWDDEGSEYLESFYKEFTKEIVCMILAYSVVVLPICYMNYSRYGVFTLDEYNSGFYADAYGAISRLHGEEGNTQVVIPYSEREKLYEHSPAFAELKPYLDGGDPRFEPWKIASDDYRTGYFSFNLRDAIAARGYYKDSQTTNRYLKQLADEVNMYCDTIAENAYSKRSTIVSRFYPEHIPDILKATFRGLGLTLGYTNVNCIPIQCEEDDKYLKVFEDFTNSTIAGNRYMETGEIIENYHLTGFARWMQRFMRVTIILYSIITPVMFVCAVVYLLFQSVMLFKKYTDEMFIKWLSGCSLLALFMLRCFMIGYVDATSYSAIDNPSYQAGSYVALWCFISLQAAVFLYEVIKIKTSKKQR